jgi:hypothetical protein
MTAGLMERRPAMPLRNKVINSWRALQLNGLEEKSAEKVHGDFREFATNRRILG